MDINNSYDFGFTFEDNELPAQVPSIDSTFKDELLTKISALEDKIEDLTIGDTTKMLDDHKQLITAEAKNKLKDIEQLILPLLYNLQKNPDKEYIHWPNRKDIIQKQIDRILEVTTYYG
jgi:DNA-directed RNA polymerase specialized sigma subunit